MAIIHKQNLYRGINAHLHSALQHERAGWSMFHGEHLSDIGRALDAQLPPGYRVRRETSLQIREFHPDAEAHVRRPDITIYDTTAGTMETLATMLPEDEMYYMALVIYRLDDGGSNPVRRIELLSPTNKPPGPGHILYREKRLATFKEEIRLIELDYLHERRSPINGVPAYPKHPKSFPYYIAVTDPRPGLEKAMTDIYGFGVNEPIPTINIPLSGAEYLTFDFNAPYQRTFESMSHFQDQSDYSRLPVNVEAYSEADRQQIEAVMKQAVAI